MAAAPPGGTDPAPLRRSSGALGHLRRLSRRPEVRREESLLLVDGPVLLGDAVAAGADIVEVFAEVGAEVPSGVPSHVPVRPVAPGELAKVLDVVTPRGVVAVVRQPRADLGALLDAGADAGRPVVLLVGIGDPGNAGTLVRVAEAAGAVGVVLTAGSVDVWGPKAVRAAAGSSLRLPVVSGAEWPAVFEAARERGVPTVATVPSDGDPPEAVGLGSAHLLCLGNEANGLPPELVEGADLRVRIPMAGGVESVNAAVAGAVLLFESARRRRVDGGGPTGSETGGGPGPGGGS